MTPQQNELWSRIEAFKIEDGKPRFGFLDRLTRENNWSLEFARSALPEYKRFIFLAVAAGHPVTPSEAVDTVWHLHLKYTRSYWERLCQGVLQQPLHHDPASGAADEDGKFADQYRRTLESYEQMFSAPPPPAIWPRAVKRPAPPTALAISNTTIRLRNDSQSIGNFRSSNNRPVIALIAALVVLLLIALSVGSMIRNTPMFGVLIALSSLVVVALVAMWVRLARQMREPIGAATSNGGRTAGCGTAGCGGGASPLLFACGGGGAGGKNTSPSTSTHHGAATQPDSNISPHSGHDVGSTGDASGAGDGAGAASCAGGSGADGAAASCGGGASCGGSGCGGGGCGSS